MRTYYKAKVVSQNNVTLKSVDAGFLLTGGGDDD